MDSAIPLSAPDVGSVEEEYLLDALRSGWVAPLGPHVDAFEAEIAARIGVAHALALNSGTAALHLSLLHLGAGPGRVVLCPSMTFAASANAIRYTGADAVFIDSLPQDGNVDAELLLQTADDLLARDVDIAAAITVDLFGRCVDYDVLERGLEERGIPLVQDAAESLGASFQGRPAGSFGRCAVLSFNGNKVMTTSGGGMLLSDDAELIAHARKLSTQAREPHPWYEHTEVGFNYRLSNLLAAVGRGQLSRLDDLIARRRAIKQRYRDALEPIDSVRLLGTDESTRFDNAWLTSVVVDRPGFDPDRVIAELSQQGIEARHLWKPMHLQPVYRESRAALTGVSQQLFAAGVNLPSGSAMSQAQQERVIDALAPLLSA